jgi:hypothetical protein
MDYAERRKQYLRVYRQQLIRETDAMGYGKANGHEPNLERQRPISPASSRQFIPVALTTPELATSQN